jgi:error-prone DNA polymerase
MFEYPTTGSRTHVPEFVHLHVHSHFSFGRGAASPVELVAAAHAQGTSALAITDRNNLYGLIWFLLAAKETGVRPLIGAEIDAEDADVPGSATRLLPGREPESECGSGARPFPMWQRRRGRSRYGGNNSRSRYGGNNSRGRYGGNSLEVVTNQHRSRKALRGSVIRTARYVPRATLLARTHDGYTNLCRLLTARHSDPEFDLADAIRQHRDGMVTLTDDRDLLETLAQDGTDDLFAEMIAGPTRRQFLSWARQRNIAPVATNDVFFLAKEQMALAQKPTAFAQEQIAAGDGGAHGSDIKASGNRPAIDTAGNRSAVDGWALHRLLRAIHLNSTFARFPAGAFARRDATLLTASEMAARFPDCPDALENTVAIAERCKWSLPLGKPIFPPFPPPHRPESWAEALAAAGFGVADAEAIGLLPAAAGDRGAKAGTTGAQVNLEQAVACGEQVDSSVAADLLERLCLAGACRRYGAASPEELPAEVTSRMAKELGIVRAKGFAEYFLVVRDIVTRWPRTCGRGSAAASLIAYCLEITHVDPIAHDLFFERFLNEERRDPPDIDVDFPWDERDQVQQYVLDAWGRERTAMVANHVCFRARAAVREVAKVWGLPDGEIAKVSKRLVRAWVAKDVERHIHEHPLFAGLKLDPPWPEILRWASRLEGTPRGISTHCGGVVIVPDELARVTPTQPAPVGVPIIHWEKDTTEEAGLLKIDLLGNRSLAVIRDALAAIEENHGHRIDYAAWDPLEDPATQALVARGDTLGVFYVESPSMRILQQKTRRGDFAHLVIHSSIIRPAANDYIEEYVRRLHGGRYKTLHPILDGLLKETYGIMCYQEDVSRTAMEMAGFSAADADELRKILSKKHQKKRLEDLRQQFFAGAAERGVAATIVEKVWHMIESFGGYSFCKPHSASYALVSFKSAWLRAHYPAEFLAAVISNRGGYYDAFAYFSEARRLGLEVLLPCVNASADATTGITCPEVVAAAETNGPIVTPRLMTEEVRGEAERWGPVSSIQEPSTGSRAPSPRGPGVGSPGPGGPGVGSSGPGGSTDETNRRSKSGSSSSDPSAGAHPTTRRDRSREQYEPTGSLRIGLMHLKGLHERVRDALLEERQAHGPFESLEDLLQRVPLEASDARILIRAGACDSISQGASRPEMMWQIADWYGGCDKFRSPKAARNPGTATREGQLLPFGDGRRRQLPTALPYDRRTVLLHELETLGYLVSCHPLDLYEHALAKLDFVPGAELHRHFGKRVTTIGWFVTAKAVSARNGEPMEFASFEDTTALYETTFFPDAYRRFCHLVDRIAPLVLQGKVEESYGAVTLTVDAVRRLVPKEKTRKASA